MSRRGLLVGLLALVAGVACAQRVAHAALPVELLGRREFVIENREVDPVTVFVTIPGRSRVRLIVEAP